MDTGRLHYQNKFEGCVTTHQLKINSEQQTLFILECRGFAYPATLDVKIMYMKIVKMIPLSRRFWDNTGFPPK